MSGWSNTNTSGSKPKYLKATDKHNDTANVYGVNVARQSLANTANYVYKGGHQGWVKIIPEYTDVHGNKRHKSETLVVISAIDKGGITGNANVLLSGTGNVSNANISTTANITASLVAANTFTIFTANVIGIIANTDIIYIANAGPFAPNVWSALNVALNIAPNFTLAGQKVNFSANTSKGNNVIIGSNSLANGLTPNTRFFHEVKVGDVLTVGNSNFQNVACKVIAVMPNTGVGEFLIVNAAFSNVNTLVSLYVTDGQWFPAT